MSSLPQNNPAGDLFHRGGGVFGSFEYDQKESRSSYDISSKKKRPAPPPPSGLSQYKPKILSSEPSGVLVVNQNGHIPVAPPRPSRRRGAGNSDVEITKPIVMGDKDVPMVLHSSQDTHDLDLNVSNLNLTSHDLLDQGGDMGTDNPLFTMHNDSTSDEQYNKDAQPDYTHKAEDEEPDAVYIPEPDYEEEEVMMTMSEELEDDHPTHPSHRTQIYKEYDGEDFGQYLSDEEGGPTTIHRSQPVAFNSADRKAKTEAKRTSKSKKNNSGFSSLRDFSYDDSKYGTTKGPKNHPSHLSGVSYEQFLRSNNEMDSGQMGYSHTYKEMESTGYVVKGHNKDSVWKKLSWKTKKQSNRFDLAASS